MQGHGSHLQGVLLQHISKDTSLKLIGMCEGCIPEEPGVSAWTLENVKK